MHISKNELPLCSVSLRAARSLEHVISTFSSTLPTLIMQLNAAL